jgi:transcriptional regulator GlxA family with amidase domain
MQIVVRLLVVIVAMLLLPVAVGAVRGVAANRSLYAPLTGAAAGATVPADAAARVHDPDKPTAVVVVGAKGAEVSDVLAPFEVLATTDAFNVYTAAPERRPLPLTGGLHLIPDLTFDELDARLGTGGAADVVVVPALPDVDKPSTAPVTDWLRRQAGDGALMVGVCSGARVLASAGLLDGRDATSHWARINDMEDDYPDVNWGRGTRYVDEGDVITTGGLLSNIDGTLRVIERLIGPDAARRAADVVGWRHYSPGAPASIPVLTLGPDAVLKPLNAAFRHARIGVVLTDGVGEMDLASVFDTHSGQSFATRTVAVAASRDAVSSRHGLSFVPTSDLHSVGDDLDRLVVPGVDAARRRDPDLAAHAVGEHGLTPEYFHAQPGFPYDAALRDLAATVDVPTARWTAKVLEYPSDDLRLAGAAWPWAITLPPLLLALAGLAVAAAVARTLRHRRGSGRAAVRAPADPDLPGSPPVHTRRK